MRRRRDELLGCGIPLPSRGEKDGGSGGLGAVSELL